MLSHFRKNTLIILLLAVATLSIQSCQSSKNAASTVNSSTTAQLSKNATPDDRFKALVGSYKNWHDVYMPVNINIEKPQALSVGSRLTMVRDSVIHISMRFFGMEVAIVHLNNDSIFIADKYHKYLFAESLQDVMAQYPITLANVQDLLLGRLFALGHNDITANDASLFDLSQSDDRNHWFAFPRKTIENIQWHFTLSNNAPCRVEDLTFLRGETPVDVSYSYPINTIIGTLPSVLKISAIFPKQQVDSSLQYKISDAQWNENRTVDWTPPRNFRRINSSNIRSIFSL